VGASLAGLRAAETLRERGFQGNLTLIGEESHEPYDRTFFSKQVALGMIQADRTALARRQDVRAEWRLGVKATGLKLESHLVELETGESVPYDRLLIATGMRARPWNNVKEAAFDGVLTLRTREDAAKLRTALARSPRRVVVIGGGFTGSEVASTCRELGLPITLIERNRTPLASALGCVVGQAAALLHIAHGVELLCGQTVVRIEGDLQNHVRQVHVVGRAQPIETDLVVVALGSISNVEWLSGSGLAVGPRGVACDASGRAFDHFGIATDDVYVAGDVARFPHPLFNFEFITQEHWSNAVTQAKLAASNMLNTQGWNCPNVSLPTFWSSQFNVSIKAVGLPSSADQVVFAQGSPDAGHFVAVYGRQGRIVAAVSFNQAKWLQTYAKQIETGAPFPCTPGMDAPDATVLRSPDFPRVSTHGLDAYITIPEQSPDGRRATLHRAPTR
jgi:NADPH-dependent 2,4-dienoyl-CoA reductase/sulfur reductase-like enzyme